MRGNGGRIMKWKRTRLLVVLLVFLSMLTDVLKCGKLVSASTDTVVLVDNDIVKLTYEAEKEKGRTIFRVKTESKGTELQRLKLQFLVNHKAVDYPKINGMTETEGWLIEEEFEKQSKQEIVLYLPKNEIEGQLYAQVDRKEDMGINENVWSNKEPYILKGKEEKTTSSVSEKKESKNTETNSSKEGKQEPEDALNTLQAGPPLTRLAASRANAALYETKTTEYTDNQTEGRYPTPNWRPVGQDNVLNHQGGLSGSSGWDGVTSWDTSNDDHSKSYIHYGDPDNANISMRKYAQETENENEFKVRLNVKGNTTYNPGVDVVFLLDNSASMLRRLSSTGNSIKNDSVSALDKIVTELAKAAKPSENNIRVGAHVFNCYTPAYLSSTGTFPLSNNPDDWQRMKNGYASLRADGATFTQRGLFHARDLFDDAPQLEMNRHKLLFILTDGAPNRSYYPQTGVINNDLYYDKVYTSNYFETGVKPNYKIGSHINSRGDTTKFDASYALYGLNGRVSINSHLTIANSSAADLKNSGIEIHSLALGIYPDRELGEQHTQAELIKGLYKMASKKANANPSSDTAADYHFYHMEQTDQMTEYFKKWYQTIIRTVDKGVIQDPLGDMVELVGEPIIRQVSNGAEAIASSDMAIVSPSADRKQINVTNINLTAKQEIEVEYKVRLKTEADGFIPGKWYPANKKTVLLPTPERTVDELDFGVPSVRAVEDDFAIQAKKQWSNDDDNKWNTRKTIDIVLEKKKADNSWEKIQEKTLTETNGWETTFDVVAREGTYRVREKTRITGYDEPTYSHSTFTYSSIGNDKTVTVTNKLLKRDFSFKKVKEDGTTTFSGTDLPKFKVYHKESKEVIAENLEPNSSGEVKVQGLPIGEYVVEETSVPDGYKKMADFTIEVTEYMNSPILETTVDGKTSHTVSNKLIADFIIPVKKQWSDRRGETENFWKMREAVTAILQRKDGDSWNDLHRITLTSATSWKGTFPAVEGGSGIQYRVIEKIGNNDKVAGYGEPVYSQTAFTSENLQAEEIVMTNKLLTTDYSFKKVGDDGRTPITGNESERPKFTVTHVGKNIEVMKDVVATTDGTVTFTGLPIGTYRVEETFVPVGYKAAADFLIEVTEKADGAGLVARVDGNEGSVTVVNRLNDFELIIDKLDDQNHSLEGATFKLVGAGTNYEKTLSTGARFLFTGLKPGTYFLEEVTLPTSYQGLKDRILIDIMGNGVVIVGKDPLLTSVASELGVSGNTIHLKIKNTPIAGNLPFTGSFGTGRTSLLAMCFIIGGIILGIVYILFTRKNDAFRK